MSTTRFSPAYTTLKAKSGPNQGDEYRIVRYNAADDSYTIENRHTYETEDVKHADVEDRFYVNLG